jgi:dihydrofolate reductase
VTRSVPPAPSPAVEIVVAMARNRVIGRDNALPWRLPEDLRHFRALTLGHPIVMGRKTWESLGRPLPGRRNLVVSRDPSHAAGGCEVFSTLACALEACGGADRIFVIGGARLYAAALPIATLLHVTEIDAEFAGDTCFPEVDWSAWREVGRESRRCAEQGFDYHFVTYERPANRD